MVHGTSARPSILGNITWLSATSLAVKPAWLLFVLVVAWRYLGTSGYGTFSAALWLAFIGASFTDLGLSTFTVREVARSPHEASKYFTNLLLLVGILSFLAIGATLTAATFLHDNPNDVAAVGWASVYATSLSVTGYVRSYYRAVENLKYEGLSVVLEKVLVIGVGSIFLVLWQSPQTVLLGMAIGMTVSLAFNVLFITNKLARIDPGSIDWSFGIGCLRKALPIGLGSLFIIIYLRIGGVLLETWHGETVAGEFAAAFRILEAMSLLPTVLTAALYPRLSAQFHLNEAAEFKSLILKSIGGSVVVSVLAATVISWLAEPLLFLINPDPSSVAASAILSQLVWLFPFMATNSLLIVALIAADDQRYLAVILGALTGLSLIFNLLLTKPMGAIGLVATLALTEVLILVFTFLRYRRIISTKTLPQTQ